MTTVSELEKMDGNAFEVFCGPVLRKMHPVLANLLPAEINNDGKTIRSLEDGFSFADSRHMVTAHVTINLSDISTKWLYDSNAPTMTKVILSKALTRPGKYTASTLISN